MKVQYRIKKHDEFQNVIKVGKSVNSLTVKLYFCKNNLGYNRFGISVPTKSGNAVVRNRIKRQVRAILGKYVNAGSGFDCVIITHRNYDINNFNQTSHDIDSLFSKVG